MAWFGFTKRCDECDGRIVNGRCEQCGKRFGKHQAVEPMEAGRTDPWEERPHSDTCWNCGAPSREERPHTGTPGTGFSSGDLMGILSQKWLCIALLLIFPLVGLILMWKYKHFPPKVRFIITLMLGLQILSYGLSGIAEFLMF